MNGAGQPAAWESFQAPGLLSWDNSQIVLQPLCTCSRLGKLPKLTWIFFCLLSHFPKE